MITHFTITPQCIDCDNPEDIVITITVTNDTEEAAEDVFLEVGPAPFGGIITTMVAQDYGSVTHGTWYEEAGQSVWSIPLIDSQETATTTITLPPGVEGADFCGPDGQLLPLTFIATLAGYPGSMPRAAAFQHCPKIEALPDSAATTDSTLVQVDVLANDLVNGEGAYGNIAGVPEIITPPANGTVEWNGTSFDYTPNPGFCGTDTFEYRILHPGGV